MTTKFKMMHQPDKILEWCEQTFGKMMPGPGRWDTYLNTSIGIDYRLASCRFFIFHRDEDAMAFKLRWL